MLLVNQWPSERVIKLWADITAILDDRMPDWRDRVEIMGLTKAVEDRGMGRKWNDAESFEALVLALLSNNTVWDNVEPLRPNLRDVFFDFNRYKYAACSDDDIKNIVGWFKERNAASMVLPRGLRLLRNTACILSYYTQQSGRSVEDLFLDGLTQVGGDPKELAILIGNARFDSKWKLPGFGIPLAAEAIRNLGFDIAKPDRHILRACGEFKLVSYDRWNRDKPRSCPAASVQEFRETLMAMEILAKVNAISVALADNAIWLACAKCREPRLWLTNSELAELSAVTQYPP